MGNQTCKNAADQLYRRHTISPEISRGGINKKRALKEMYNNN
jgi:hypothetical protein